MSSKHASAFLVVALGAACAGAVEEQSDSTPGAMTPSAGAGSARTGTPGSPGSPGAPGGAPTQPGGSTPTAPTDQPRAAPGELPWPVQLGERASGLRRLSRDEIVASTEALTGVALSLRELPDEPRSGHGALLTGGMTFIATEISKLNLALADFSRRAAPAVLTRSACAQVGAAQQMCLLTFVQKLVERGWRRPLKPAEVTRFTKLLSMTGTSKELDTVAMEGVLSALFFAPSFLYRTEIGAPIAGRTDLRALTGPEVATRLSFLATLAPPDAELWSAALGGRLAEPAERVRHFERLSQTPLGKRALATFVLEWFGAGESKVADKSSRYLAGLPSDVEKALRAGAEAAVKATLDSADPTLGNLLSTTGYLQEPTVAKLRMPFGTGKLAAGDPEPSPRMGLLMHPHVLSSHTKEDGASPFQLGHFLRENLLCQKVPEAPAGAQDAAKMNPPAGLSIREDLEYRTNVGGPCQACHTLFAPLGYAFLPFDPVGRWVTKDPSGKPWDLAGKVETFTTPLAWKGPDELVQGLGASAQVHGCFSQGAIEWTLGRRLLAEDKELLAVAAESVRRTRGAVPALLSSIVGAPSFLNVVAAR